MSKWMNRSVALLLLAGSPAALAEHGTDAVQASESATTPRDGESRRIQALEAQIAALHAREKQNQARAVDSQPKYDTDSHPLWP